MKTKEKIENLMKRNDLQFVEMSFLRECKHNFDYWGFLKEGEEEELNVMYSRYFIDFEKSKIENQHLEDF